MKKQYLDTGERQTYTGEYASNILKIEGEESGWLINLWNCGQIYKPLNP